MHFVHAIGLTSATSLDFELDRPRVPIWEVSDNGGETALLESDCRRTWQTPERYAAISVAIQLSNAISLFQLPPACD